MKNIILTATLCAFSFCLFGQSLDEPFNFTPLTIGGQLKGVPYTEKVKRLQLPEATLKQMSTEALIETCINYPLFHVITAYTNTQEGFNQVSKDFNGFQELFNRPDVEKSLLKKYSSINMSALDGIKEPFQQGKFMAEVLYCELLLAQKGVFDKFSDSDLQALLSSSYNKYNEKTVYNISSFNKEFSVLVMGKAFNKVGGSESASLRNQSDVKRFLESATITTPNTSDKILKAVTQYIKASK